MPKNRNVKKVNTAQKAKKGLFSIIFSRAGIILLLILIQLGLFFATSVHLVEYRVYISGFLKILSIVVLIYIINEEGNPAFKTTWILFVMAFPVPGTLFYLYVKNQWGTKFMKERLATLKIETDPYMMQRQEVVDAIWASKSANANLAYYLSNRLGFPTYRNTEVKYFSAKEDLLESLPGLLQEGDTVLVKASHGMHFEEVVAWLEKQ